MRKDHERICADGLFFLILTGESPEDHEEKTEDIVIYIFRNS